MRKILPPGVLRTYGISADVSLGAHEERGPIEGRRGLVWVVERLASRFIETGKNNIEVSPWPFSTTFLRICTYVQ